MARGSIYESKTRITKAQRRKIISAEVYNELLLEFNKLGTKQNHFINSITKLMNAKNNAEAK